MATNTFLNAIETLFLIFGILIGSIRFLRISQREHYLVGSLIKFYLRWHFKKLSLILTFTGLSFSILSLWFPILALLVLPCALISPLGLSYKGRSSRLVWTRRLKTLFFGEICLVGLVSTILLLVFPSRNWPFIGSIELVFSPLFVEIVLIFTKPFEKFVINEYVKKAKIKLDEINPRVVAIAGSFGKTSTKEAVGKLIANTYITTLSPASFNNTNGLTKTVLGHLSPDCQVLVAEMGTYGIGEIASLVSWMPPDISVITAIGPVHLERMKSEDNIVRAKSEIITPSSKIVLNIDNARLEQLRRSLLSSGREVLSVSGLESAKDKADLCIYYVESFAYLYERGVEIAKFDTPGIPSSNLACAFAVGHLLSVGYEEMVERSKAIKTSDHRASVSKSGSGVIVVDDTYNANPSGTALALQKVNSLRSADSKVIVVTPGMVELGALSFQSNFELGSNIKAIGAELIVVGYTNMKALLKGYPNASWVKTRDEAVELVRASTKNGDVVAYLNDLPDHFP